MSKPRYSRTMVGAQIMQFVDRYWAKHYCQPTLREIAESIGINSTNTIWLIMEDLVKRGYLVKRSAPFYRHAQYTPSKVVEMLRNSLEWNG